MGKVKGIAPYLLRNTMARLVDHAAENMTSAEFVEAENKANDITNRVRENGDNEREEDK